MNELKTELTFFYEDGSHETHLFNDENYEECLKLRFWAENNPRVVYISDVTALEIIKE